MEDNLMFLVEMGVSVVALVLMGALATFFVYLSSHKREFWELIYETNNKNYDKRH